MTDSSPTVGDPAPAFDLTGADGRPVRLADFASRSVIVYFYPAAMTPGCTTQACDFTAARADLDAAGWTVIGISPDDPATLARFVDESRLDLILAADPDHAVATAYGAYGEKKLYGRTVVGIIRSTFLIGPDGLVQKAWRGVKATGHVARVLAEVGPER